jgi:tetratricopeptide (TPR) repeat protein
MSPKGLFLILFTFMRMTVYGQETDANKIQSKLLRFEKLFEKEKFEKAAPYYEWLLENAEYIHQDFYNRGFMMYDFLYAIEDDPNTKAHYKKVLDIIKDNVDQELSEILQDRYEKQGMKLESLQSEPIEGSFAQFDLAPEFPGGLENFYEHILTEIDNSTIRKQSKGINQRVFIVFVVNADGRVINGRLLESIKPEIDNEFIRIVESSPRWIPAEKNGVPVAARFVLPITIKMRRFF